jgi:pimeloyl-ACP methyl ester carboxylesterase
MHVMVALAGMTGCAAVTMSEASPSQFVTERRGDVLSTGRLSDTTNQALNVVALTPKGCSALFRACLQALENTTGLTNESRLAAQSELWLSNAIEMSHKVGANRSSSDSLNAFLQCARLAYAYLFFTQRSFEDRALETRQSQVIGYYNYCAQKAVTDLFVALPDLRKPWQSTEVAGWIVARPTTDLTFGSREFVLRELLPAAGLKFEGLRNIYKRDGVGGEFVAVAEEISPVEESQAPSWRELSYGSLTALLHFPGDNLDEVMSTRQVQISGLDPYEDSSTSIAGRTVPIAANYTAPYGVWLARSGFNRQSFQSLLGGKSGIAKPEVILMRPFDPDRLTLIMIHGLASSPEAWVNLNNELLGDEELRKTYQVWEVYYPTSLPILVNLANIRTAIDTTIRRLDPDRSTIATHNMVLVGHSMGGVLARLLVSTSGDELWNLVPRRADLAQAEVERLHDQLRPYLEFSPMSEVTRAIFLATPHRGTPLAQNGFARMVRGLIHLPGLIVSENASLIESMRSAEPQGTSTRLPTAIDDLSNKNRFVRAAAELPIATTVRYHSIVGVNRSHGPIELASDGYVPYWSAHLSGAQSELTIPSGHSVQETPQAILELRRILRLHASELQQLRQ